MILLDSYNTLTCLYCCYDWRQWNVLIIFLYISVGALLLIWHLRVVMLKHFCQSQPTMHIIL